MAPLLAKRVTRLCQQLDILQEFIQLKFGEEYKDFEKLKLGDIHSEKVVSVETVFPCAAPPNPSTVSSIFETDDTHPSIRTVHPPLNMGPDDPVTIKKIIPLSTPILVPHSTINLSSSTSSDDSPSLIFYGGPLPSSLHYSTFTPPTKPLGNVSTGSSPLGKFKCFHCTEIFTEIHFRHDHWVAKHSDRFRPVGGTYVHKCSFPLCQRDNLRSVKFTEHCRHSHAKDVLPARRTIAHPNSTNSKRTMLLGSNETPPFSNRDGEINHADINVIHAADSIDEEVDIIREDGTDPLVDQGINLPGTKLRQVSDAALVIESNKDCAENFIHSDKTKVQRTCIIQPLTPDTSNEIKLIRSSKPSQSKSYRRPWPF
ncbi:uncharacterized protein LOC110854695 isoform X2 [Folsomia candida]|uniref:uncharacterized protein LOC110854695 isoform X2 n=1 Tax=Folsomia candida TaxID=158441 RepID=UPI000B908836|nr:uncharacterized protein LOC110854695 isoform X2 [Folsomia candida]